MTGVILLALGWFLDSSDFWTNRPFLTNVASSLSGVMIGVPLAILLMRRLDTEQAEAHDRRQVQRLAATAATELRAVAVAALVDLDGQPDEILRTLHEAATAASELLDEQRTRLRRRLAAKAGVPGMLFDPLTCSDDTLEQWEQEIFTTDESEVFARAALQILNGYQGGFQQAVRRLDEQAITRWTALLRDQWALLDRDVRIRIVAADLPWLPVGNVISTREALEGLTSVDFFMTFEHAEATDYFEENLLTPGQIYRHMVVACDVVNESRTWIQHLLQLIGNADQSIVHFQGDSAGSVASA
ncbi:hypothetical protein ACFCXH_02770 [Streptomyces nojiriensis]|uniref:hypothetical protein n=1 Tax=Streptomyces nojiriensis TaxID=66374 RepID=UPI0035E117E5